MRRFASIMLVCLFATTAAAETKLVRHAGGIANRYIVVLRGHGADLAVDRLAVGRTVSHRYTGALRGFAAELSDADAEALSRDPDVAYVEQDTPVYTTAIQANAPWGLDRIDQAALPVDTKFLGLGDGEGTTVYVIDTGIRRAHTEFTGRILPGGTAISDGNGVEDCNGHGTHVAGTIAGTSFGVAKKASIVPVRVFDCTGAGSASNVIAGIDFVRQNHRPNAVANLSLGGPVNAAQDEAIRNLINAGVTVVVAAGNDNQDACLQSPAREPLAITVAASGQTDARASFSNFGTCVDVFAPGVNIVSAGIANDSATATLSGTSMASPHVAGAAAAYLGANLGATPAQVGAALLAGTTPGKITDLKGSPNLLLNTAFVDAVDPVAMITSPANGAAVTPSLIVEGTASDLNLDRVDLEIDGTLVDTATESPFRFEVAGLAAGSHTLVVTALDLAGHATVQTVTVTVAGDDGEDPTPDPEAEDPATGGCSTGGNAGLALGLALAALVRPRRKRA